MYPETSQTPRLMILTDGYPPDGQGGATRIPYYQAKGFKERGWDVAVVTSFHDFVSKRAQITVEEGITIYRVFPIQPFSRTQSASVWDNAFRIAFTVANPLMKNAIRDAINHFNPNILHAHHIPRISYEIFASTAPSLPRVLTFHTYAFECPKGGLFRKRKKIICSHKPLPCQIYQSRFHKSLRPVNKIVAISNFIKDRLLLAGHDPDKITYIPNGVPNLEDREFIPPSNNHHILYVGRLDHNKGLLDLINAFTEISGKSERLVIIGDGPIRSKLEQAAQHDPRIEFLGWLKPDEVNAWYRRSRMVVVPSVWHEVMNTVICEAQSWGRPVIATRVGGNADMIKHQNNGFLVNAGDVLELRASMIRLLVDGIRTDEVGFNGYKTIKQYGIERHLNALETLFAELQI